MSDKGQEHQEQHGRRGKPRPEVCRRYARKRLAAGLPSILDCFIKQACGGSVPHMKVLMLLSGVDKEGPARVKGRKGRRGYEGLSELLLAELRKEPSRPDEEE